MKKEALAKLVEAWIDGVVYGRDENGRETDVYEKNCWALQKVMRWMHDNEPELLWQFILAVHERDADEKAAGHLAAGPVEDLMSEFGEDYIERVEEMARKDTRFRQMLCGVWQDRMSDELWSRFRRARAGAC